MVLRQLAARRTDGRCLSRAKELALLWSGIGRRCRQEISRRTELAAELESAEVRCAGRAYLVIRRSGLSHSAKWT